MTKRKKSKSSPPEPVAEPQAQPEIENDDAESVTVMHTVAPEVLERARRSSPPESPSAPADSPSAPVLADDDIEVSASDAPSTPVLADDDEGEEASTSDAASSPDLVDDLGAPTIAFDSAALAGVDAELVQRKHLRGLIEALIFASDSPIKPHELSKLAHAPVKEVKTILAELKQDYAIGGVHLDEVAGGWVFRTSPQYAPFIRDLTKQKPVRLTRAQVETLAIIAYRQPMTRPEIDDVRGVDSGPVLKLLLERDLVRILGKRDEPGRPLIYGTTGHFLEFFGLKSLKDLPTLREFTELTDESRMKYETEIGEEPGGLPPEGAEAPAVEIAGEEIAGEEVAADAAAGDDVAGDHVAGDDVANDDVAADDVAGDASDAAEEEAEPSIEPMPETLESGNNDGDDQSSVAGSE